MSSSYGSEDSPWRKTVLDHTNLFIKYNFSMKSYNIKMTDLVFIYEENLDEAQIQERFCLLNPYAEMNSKRLLDNLQLCLEQNIPTKTSEDCNITISNKTDDNIHLKLKFIVAHISLFWEFNMLCLHPLQMFVHIVQPMMYIANDRDKRCLDLIQIIKEKDREIEEHRSGGSKAFKETAVFNEEEFISKDIDSKMLHTSDMSYLMTSYENLYSIMLLQKRRSAVSSCANAAESETRKTDESSSAPLKRVKIEVEEPERVEDQNSRENDHASEQTAGNNSDLQLQQQTDVKIKKPTKIIKF